MIKIFKRNISTNFIQKSKIRAKIILISGDYLIKYLYKVLQKLKVILLSYGGVNYAPTGSGYLTLVAVLTI